MDLFNMTLLLKLVVSALLGLVIGIERELKRKPLGLKTSPVISIISCLLTIVSIETAYMLQGSDDIRIQMDPLRLAAQIVSGVGFIGAGVILRRGNDHITGLTTAAMIWGAAGIGIAVGSGFYIEAAAGVLLVIISVEFIPFLLSIIGSKRLLKNDFSIKIVVTNKASLETIINKLKAEKISITYTKIKDIRDNSAHMLELQTRVSVNRSVTSVYYEITNMDDVESVEIIS